ncbi:50S ribosomal protein L10 [Candidatus Marinamargulisbacteria bacterium SCGC AAA071-K20]|nr:50S ribosomal protein L10 [Candidatus Marinamargulisbacteria bacterium SCGC AAA071-K20]
MGKTFNQEKVDSLASIRAIVDESKFIVMADFRGLDVTTITELRSQLRDNDATAKVCKNTLTRMVFKEKSLDYPSEALQGPTMVVTSSKDASSVSKILVKFSKQNENLDIKGGILDNQFVDIKIITELSKLPSKQELIAKTIGQIKAPLTGLVASLSSPVNGFINVLRSIQEKKQ